MDIIVHLVAPLMGAWIEIPEWDKFFGTKLVSRPSWARGLKFHIAGRKIIQKVYVAPLMGAWIEIFNHVYILSNQAVAPLMGAWIEIFIYAFIISYFEKVAPLMGAWIEIQKCLDGAMQKMCRAPHGRVD